MLLRDFNNDHYQPYRNRIIILLKSIYMTLNDIVFIKSCKVRRVQLFITPTISI